MALDPAPKDLKHLERCFISKKILFKNIAMIYWKGEFSKIKGTAYNAPIKLADICIILIRSEDYNGPSAVHFEQELKYNSNDYSKPAHPTAINQTLKFLKLNNEFSNCISFSEGLKSNKELRFPEIRLTEENREISLTEKISFSYRKFSLTKEPLHIKQLLC